MDNYFKSIQQENFTIQMNNYDLTKNNKQKKKSPPVSYNKQPDLEQQKKRQIYRQNVKSYTKKLIGRKISENVRTFTDIQINQGDLTLKNPALMRIISKWCDQLRWNFDVDRYILIKDDQFRMKDGSQKILKRKNLLILSELLKIQQKKVLDYLKKVNENNDNCKYDFANLKWNKQYDKFTENQVQVGLFASNIIRNYQAYLVGYVNTIIHALMTATKHYEQIIKAYQYKQKQFSQQMQNCIKKQISIKQLILKAYKYRLANAQSSFSNLIPQLISFRVGDIMRCKCISKQKEIIALYTDLKRKSDQKDNTIKIVKINNRLQQGTKDILINILYRQLIVIQMQLAISTTGTKFVDYSIKFNHMLYQLRRAQFGPIIQMCNIWINNDLKAQFYLEKADLINTRQIMQKKKMHICKGKKNQMPFRCSHCSYFYNDCQYKRSHIQCQDKTCQKFVCSLCQAQKLNHKDLSKQYKTIPQEQFLGMQKGQDYLSYKQKKLYLDGKQIYSEVFKNKQNAGLMIDLKGLVDADLKWCKAFKVGKKHIILYTKDKENPKILILRQLHCQDDIQNFKKQFLIFESDKITNQINEIDKKVKLEKQLTKYYFPLQIKKWKKREKTSIVYMKRFLSDQQINKIQDKFVFAKKVCFYENKITDFNLVASKFSNVQILDLGANQIETIQIKRDDQYSQLNFPNLKVLYLNYNKILKIDPSFIQKFNHLQELQLSHNNLQSLPDNFGTLSQLKYLNISRNNFKQFSIQITKLTELQVLYLYSEQFNKSIISEIPKQIQNLKKLRKLNLNFNNIIQFPQTFGTLHNLQVLYAVDNCLKALPNTFENLKKLKILNLALNNFAQIPEIIGKLQQLQVLHLQYAFISAEQQKVAENYQKLLQKHKIQKKKSLPQPEGNQQLLKSQKKKIKKELSQIKHKKIPESFCNLVKLRMLDISHNQITHLPQNLGNLKQLDTLLIFQNYIQQLPQSFGQLQKLRLLYASDNNLYSLPGSICKLQNLSKITLQNNLNLKSLPSKFHELKSLKFLLCRGSGLKSLPSQFHKLGKLSCLDIKGTQINANKQYFSNMEIKHLFTKQTEETLESIQKMDEEYFDEFGNFHFQ